MGIFLRILLACSLCLPLNAVAASAHGNDGGRLPAAKPAAAWAVKFNNKGVDLFNAGKYEQAIQSYNEAIRLNPDYTEAYSNRGAAFDALNNPERAVQDYTAAIELNPQLTPAFSNRAAAYGDLGNFEKAIEDWNVVIQRTPRDPLSYNGRGSCYKALGNLDAALRDFDKAISLRPGSLKALKNRDAVKSSMAASVSVRQPPAPPLVPEQPAGTTSSLPAGAKPTVPSFPQVGLEPVLPAKVPSGVPVDNSSAGARTADSRTSTSPSAIGGEASLPSSVRANMPSGPLGVCGSVIHHLTGNMYYAFGQYKAAADQYQMAMNDNPADPYAYFRQGNAFTHLGYNQQAMADYEAALRLSPHGNFRPAYVARDRLRSAAARALHNSENR